MPSFTEKTPFELATKPAVATAIKVVSNPDDISTSITIAI